MKGPVGSDEGKIWVRCFYCEAEWRAPTSEGVNVRCTTCGRESNATEAANFFMRMEQAAMPIPSSDSLVGYFAGALLNLVPGFGLGCLVLGRQRAFLFISILSVGLYGTVVLLFWAADFAWDGEWGGVEFVLLAIGALILIAALNIGTAIDLAVSSASDEGRRGQ